MVKYKYLFPYHKIKRGSCIVLYGAGIVGNDFLNQMKENNYCEVLYSVDKNWQQLDGVVYSPEKLLENPDIYDAVVVSADYYTDSIILALKAMGIPSSKVVTVFRFGSRVYSANGEDVIVYTLFKLLGLETFRYIDIGANDPYRNSNTAYLYVHGCRGICVEPNPGLIELLRTERPEDIVLNIGVGLEQGILPYWMFENDIYNTFSEPIAQGNSAVMPCIEVKQIPVETISKIIERHNGGVYPNFLQIDIEGLDYEVLQGLDFSHSSPDIICTEVGDEDEEKFNIMLSDKGFLQFQRTGANIIYIRNLFSEFISQINMELIKAKSSDKYSRKTSSNY